MKRAIYRKWIDWDGDYYCYARIFQRSIMVVSFREKKVRVIDDVKIFFDPWDIIRDRKKLPVCRKDEFYKALNLAQKKLMYLSRVDKTKFTYK